MSYFSVRDHTRRATCRLTLLASTMFPTAALAYVGPGAGLSVIGSLLAFLAAIVVAVLGFLFFPIRRLLRKRKQSRAAREAAPAGKTPDPAEPPAATEAAPARVRTRDPERK